MHLQEEFCVCVWSHGVPVTHVIRNHSLCSMVSCGAMYFPRLRFSRSDAEAQWNGNVAELPHTSGGKVIWPRAGFLPMCVTPFPPWVNTKMCIPWSPSLGWTMHLVTSLEASLRVFFSPTQSAPVAQTTMTKTGKLILCKGWRTKCVCVVRGPECMTPTWRKTRWYFSCVHLKMKKYSKESKAHL